MPATPSFFATALSIECVVGQLASTRTFRLFVSSSFLDFQQERKFLHEKVCANVQIDPNPQRAAQVIIGATNTAHLFSCFFAVACFFGRLLLVGVPASATRL